MIKAVFFDLYHTLIGYDPPREQALAEMLNRMGFSAPLKVLRRSLIAADEFFYRETTKKALKDRDNGETLELWNGYYSVALHEAGLTPASDVISVIIGEMQKTGYEMALFDDVLPALNALSQRKLLLGLISNVDRDISPMLDRLGILSLLQFRVTSQEAGVAKPHPGIFRKGVERAGIAPDEALYVGDQWVVDVQAARDAGMRSLLIDRGDFFDDIRSCDKISSLKEIEARL